MYRTCTQQVMKTRSWRKLVGTHGTAGFTTVWWIMVLSGRFKRTISDPPAAVLAHVVDWDVGSSRRFSELLLYDDGAP